MLLEISCSVEHFMNFLEQAEKFGLKPDFDMRGADISSGFGSTAQDPDSGPVEEDEVHSDDEDIILNDDNDLLENEENDNEEFSSDDPDILLNEDSISLSLDINENENNEINDNDIEITK